MHRHLLSFLLLIATTTAKPPSPASVIPAPLAPTAPGTIASPSTPHQAPHRPSSRKAVTTALPDIIHQALTASRSTALIEKLYQGLMTANVRQVGGSLVGTA